MKRSRSLLLHDALIAVDEIAAIVDQRDAAPAELARFLGMAVERQLTILGEALSALRKLEPGILQDLPDADYAIRMRHVLVHGYAAVDAEQVWSTAIDDVPKLRDALRALLRDDELPSGPPPP
jgi:uncharacterized protein with HEPN domain